MIDLNQQNNSNSFVPGPHDGGFDTSGWGNYTNYYPIQNQNNYTNTNNNNNNNNYNNNTNNNNNQARGNQRPRSNQQRQQPSNNSVVVRNCPS